MTFEWHHDFECGGSCAAHQAEARAAEEARRALVVPKVESRQQTQPLVESEDILPAFGFAALIIVASLYILGLPGKALAEVAFRLNVSVPSFLIPLVASGTIGATFLRLSRAGRALCSRSVETKRDQIHFACVATLIPLIGFTYPLFQNCLSPWIWPPLIAAVLAVVYALLGVSQFVDDWSEQKLFYVVLLSGVVAVSSLTEYQSGFFELTHQEVAMEKAQDSRLTQLHTLQKAEVVPLNALVLAC